MKLKTYLIALMTMLLMPFVAFADIAATSSESSAGGGTEILGGAGSIGNGIALSGSSTNSRQYSAGVGLSGAIGGSNGALSGSTTSTVHVGSADATNFSASAGQAGGFSGSAVKGQSKSKARARARGN
jgi:hypothetical protein